MTHALAAREPRAGFGLAQTIRALPYAAFTLVVATVLVFSVGIANLPAVSPSGDAADAVPPGATRGAVAATPPSTDGPMSASEVRARTRCAGCGVVESIRPLEATANLPAAFEFTVRLRDGSARVSRTIGRGQWRAGDRIILMGGAGGARE